MHKVNAQESIQQYPKIEIKTEQTEPELLKEEIKIEQPVKEEQSSIEKMFNARSARPLKQFGYSFFKRAVVKGFLPVGDEYTIGPGDTVALYFWGDPVDILDLQGFYTITIDRDGKIYIPNLGVFYVWGLNVSQTKDIIYKAMARKFKKFEIEVTLGKLREFPVYVSGYVKQPGMVLATGVYSVLDALTAAGGIEKNGSLRDIVLKRMEKSKIKEIKIDLYDLLIHGKPVDIKVKEGDSILVNPVGKTSGISGVIKRPGIYELTGNHSIEDLINLSGGILPSAYSVGVKLIRYEEDTLKIYEGNLKSEDFLHSSLNDGDFILIGDIHGLIANEIIIRGHIAYPGKYAYTEGMKLSSLLKKAGILPDTNVNLAEIRREKQNEVVNFSPEDILAVNTDVLLEKRDIITFYPEQVYKPVQIAGEIENPLLIPYYSGITLLDVLNSADFKADIKDLKAEVYREGNRKYQVVYLYDLMIRGLKKENVSLMAGDRVLIKSIEPMEKSAVVTVLGEVKNPGVYEYKKDMKLYDVLLKSGGYTENAYPFGLIYIKENAKKLQQEQIDFIFLTLEEYLLKTEESAPYLSEVSQAEKDILRLTLLKHKQLLENLKKRSQFNLGRISLNIPDTLEELKENPDNIVIDEGDYIYIPKKPNHILVLGDVYNQISLPFKERYSVKQYIRAVGGFTKNSDKKDIYIIKANGKVVSQRQYSSAKFYTMKLNRGDTIIIPSKMKVPVIWRLLLRDTTQIIFQAMSTVALAASL
ncbi:hypothetical protein ES705_18133 [subsurface metagenome]